ncbi:hypothetical protein VTH8203_00855 [Vibrio thalassae]|uniref:Uncharacterized protein n=1 Tax=Vibrio thalassae TaxID=1243014 RepID=A0A240EEZ5_9VIBR|nr:hypothetical protein [Vibrio thalassae]SNX47254.1 hypothetical protein VTH8203_00855 [Vibrio thalassae]
MRHSKFLTLVLSALTSFTVAASVSDLKNAPSAKPLPQAKTVYNANASGPGYQTNNLGGTWSPDLNLNNSSGKPMLDLSDSTGAPRINLDQATGTPTINLAKSYGINHDIANNSNGGWHVQYNGAGTQRIESPDFVAYRIWYKWQDTDWKWKTGYRKGLVGDTAIASDTKSKSEYGKCGGEWKSVSAGATANLPIHINRVTTSYGEDNAKTTNCNCGCVTARASVRNAHITRLEIYR